jgi:predicted metal-dependent phosphoesterase TrpH
MEKIDMHVFTTVSHPQEGAATPKEAVKIALKRGMNGLGIADHDKLGAAKEARSHAPRDFIILEGIEISTHEGHVVAFGLGEWGKGKMHLDETLDHIKESAGIALLPHPNISVMATSIVEPNIKDFKEHFAGMYLLSTRHLLFYRQMRSVHKKYGFPALGCSYAHRPFEIGTAYTLFDGVSTEDDVLGAIMKNNIFGPKLNKTPAGLANTARSNCSTVKKFTKHKFGWEVNQRLVVCGEAISGTSEKMGEFTRASLIDEIITSDALAPDYRQDILFTLILDEMLGASVKDGALTKDGEKYVAVGEREITISKSSRRKIYLKYFAELVRGVGKR